MSEKSPRRPFKLPIDTTDDKPQVMELNGTRYEVCKDGTLRANLDKLERIAIGNVLEMTKHVISSMDGRTMHIFEFMNGGHGEITFTANGQLEVFEIHDLTALVSKDGKTVTIGTQLVTA